MHNLYLFVLACFYVFRCAPFFLKCRKVKDAWDNKRDMLVKSGTLAIEQLSEALSATASANKVPDALPHDAINQCAEQVSIIISVNQCGVNSMVVEIKDSL